MIAKALVSMAACLVMSFPLTVGLESSKAQEGGTRISSPPSQAPALAHRSGLYLVDPPCSRFVDHPAFCQGSVLIRCDNGVRTLTRCSDGCTAAENFGLNAACQENGSTIALSQ